MALDNITYFSELPTELRLQIYRYAMPSRILQVGYDFPFPFLPGPTTFRRNKVILIPTRAILPNLFHICHESRSLCLSVYAPFAYTYAHPVLDTLYFTRHAVAEFVRYLRQIEACARPPLYPMALLDRIAVEYNASDTTTRIWMADGQVHTLGWMKIFGYPKEVLLVRGPRQQETDSTATGRVRGWKGLTLFDKNDEEVAVPGGSSRPDADEIELRRKEVLFLRHRIQKDLLMRPHELKVDQMARMSGWFSKLESYNYLQVGILQVTEINQVVEEVLKLEVIPMEEDFHFKPRSQALVDRWNKSLAKAELLLSAPRKGREQDGEQWLSQRLPTLSCVSAIKEGLARSIVNSKFRRLKDPAAEVASEWVEGEQSGGIVAYDMEGTAKALERAGIHPPTSWKLPS